jgi:hypothetical protein
MTLAFLAAKIAFRIAGATAFYFVPSFAPPRKNSAMAKI